jgi:hypothetical protein
MNFKMSKYIVPTVGLFVFSYVSFVQAATDCAVQTQIPETECLALVDLYTSTNGANWGNNTGWNVTSVPCTWRGISCDGGHVTKLQLSSYKLSGSIP